MDYYPHIKMEDLEAQIGKGGSRNFKVGKKFEDRPIYYTDPAEIEDRPILERGPANNNSGNSGNEVRELIRHLKDKTIDELRKELESSDNLLNPPEYD